MPMDQIAMTSPSGLTLGVIIPAWTGGADGHLGAKELFPFWCHRGIPSEACCERCFTVEVSMGGPRGSSQSLGFPSEGLREFHKAYSILMNGENNLRTAVPISKSREHPDTPFFSVES